VCVGVKVAGFVCFALGGWQIRFFFPFLAYWVKERVSRWSKADGSYFCGCRGATERNVFIGWLNINTYRVADMAEKNFIHSV